jgi:heme exporter protein D
MNWNSLDDFLAMGGYGLYVWGSFGVTALTMAIEPLLIRKRRNDILRTLRREYAAEKENA